MMIERVALLSVHSSPLARVGSSHAGGMNLYVRRLADDLSRTGLRVDMFTRRTDRSSPEIVTLASGARLIHLSAGPARILPKNVLPLHVPGIVGAMRSFMEREDISYDVLHGHYWLSGLVAARVRDDVRTPIVHMFHTLSKAKEFHLGRPDPSDSALRPDGERCVINSADVIVGATESEKEYIEKLYSRTPARFDVIPPGVDLDHFRPRGKRSSRKALGITGDRVVLFVGRCDRIKGLDHLLYAMADIAPSSHYPLRLVVLGHDGDQRQVAAYRQMASRLGLDAIVDFRGVVSQEELPLYYSAADVLAMPSAYESFGMAAVEALACQTPVVAFRVGGLAVTIKDGQTGFLAAPGDRSDLTAKLQTALWSEDLEVMGRQARLSAQRYRWENVARRTMTLYQQLHAGRFQVPAHAGR